MTEATLAMTSLFAFDINSLHMAILAAIVVLLFGTRLPSVMRSLGNGFRGGPPGAPLA
ncbi:MAG: twin-arginine translocase TatA/TatE family subunit [Planctomycetia bacterium]|nr:twin-arginine translocase TatA/TatE family subunit [Planctomycetia bacterium]